MFSAFKDSENYTLPNGRKRAGSELKADAEYSFLTTETYAVDIIDGIVRSFISLAQLKDKYAISDDDIDTVISKSNTESERIQKARTIFTEQALIQPSMLKAAMFSAVAFTDAQALEVRDLYPEFEVGHDYKKDERFTYNGHLFKVNQDHTSQEQWVSGETGTESLYTNLEMGENGHLNWQQPTGAHDAYNTGDIVNYNGQMYQSQIDGNTTVPGSDERWWKVYIEE